MRSIKLTLTLSLLAVACFASSPVSDFTRPLSFEPNRGQTEKQVDFIAHGLKYDLFLSHAGAVMVFGGSVVGMKPVGANASSRGQLIDQLPGKSNYFIGNDPAKWRTNVPTYLKVRYANVYKGVDLSYYGNQRQLEYDFVVQPGADPSAISLEFESAGQPSLTRNGQLVLHTSAGDLTWHKPVAYQELNGTRKPVECAYIHEGRQFDFVLGAYDATKPLVIDPVLVYSTYLGVTRGDLGQGIAVDQNGNAYVTGIACSANFPTKDPFQSKKKAPSCNAFVTKFDAAGTGLVYSTYLGGSKYDFAYSIAVDNYGEAYVTGGTESTDFPTKNAFQNSLKSYKDYAPNAFVTKFAADGAELVFSTYLGGTGTRGYGDIGYGIAVGPAGNAYVTGTTYSPNFPTKNAFQNSTSSSFYGSAFVSKFAAIGDLVYSSYLSGSSASTGAAIAVDANGSAYVTGETYGGFPLKNPYQSTDPAEGIEGIGYVTKFAPSGDALVYSTYLGGGGEDIPDGCQGGDYGTGIAVNSSGEASVTGVTYGGFPTENASLTGKGQCYNGFITKFNAAGSDIVFSTYVGGSGQESKELNGVTYADDSTSGVAVDKDGNTYVTGRTWSDDFPIKNAFQDKNNAYPGIAAFVIKLCPAGTLLYSSYLGGSNNDQGNSIAADSEGDADVTGVTTSTDFPTHDPFQSSLKSVSENAFVTKVSSQ